MDVARPYLALLPPVRAATLLALRRTVAPMTGREVARRAGVSQPAVLEALKQFVEHGLVWSQPAGGANLYSLNEEHLLVAAVDEIFDVRAKFVNRMAAAVSHWEIPPLHVSVFGSMARGDGGRDSDIDLLVVRPRFVDEESDDFVWRGQLDTLVHEVKLWTGNRAALVELSSEELRTMNRDKHRLLTEIRRDGIRVCGEYLDKILLRKPERARQHSVAG
jgi:predicted nucleotidyltransferase